MQVGNMFGYGRLFHYTLSFYSPQQVFDHCRISVAQHFLASYVVLIVS